MILNSVAIPASELDRNATIWKIGQENEVRDFGNGSSNRGVIAKFKSGEFCFAACPTAYKPVIAGGSYPWPRKEFPKA